LLLLKSPNLGVTFDDLLLRRSTINCTLVHARANLLLQSSNSLHEELVEIGGGDSQEFDSFQQRVAFVQGFFEDPAVERQPGLVAIEVIARIAKAGAGDRRDFLPQAW